MLEPRKFMNEGYIDSIDHAFIIGWAFGTDQDTPANVSGIYNGEEYAVVQANVYRRDLALKGVGRGNHGFRLPLPCPAHDFDPAALQIRIGNGSALHQGHGFLAALEAAKKARVEFAAIEELDLLASPATRTIHLEFTNRCNLRCLYCAVSKPNYLGKDMEVEDFDNLVAELKKRNVELVVVSGHGETTLVEGWHRKILALANAGFHLAIVTNFARLLSDEELEAMAHIEGLQISVDTHNAEVLRKTRRKVDLGNILINMFAVRSKADALGLPKPCMSWSCVLHRMIAPDVVDFVRFGLNCGVQRFTFCNLAKYDDIEGAEEIQHVTTLPLDQLVVVAEKFREARELAQRSGASVVIQSGLIDTIQQKIAMEKTS